jgi:predicted transcriptional regulator
MVHCQKGRLTQKKLAIRCSHAPFEKYISKKFLNHKEQTNAEQQIWFGSSMGKLEEVVMSALKDSGKALTLNEIAEKIGQPEKKVYKELRSLFEKGFVDSENRRYKLTKDW